MEEINVVGIGLDGRLGLSESTQSIVQQATVLAGARRHLSYFSEHPATKIVLQDLTQNIDSIEEQASAGERVVILASGDPLFFGLGRLLVTKLPSEKLNFYPHVSSIQLAFSKLKIPWQDARLVSVHGRDCDELVKCWRQGVTKIAVLTDAKYNPVAIARLYLSLKPATTYKFIICSDLSLKSLSLESNHQDPNISEGIQIFEPSAIQDLAELAEDSFSSLNIVVLLKQDAKPDLDLVSLPLLGIEDRDFLSFSDRPGLITKKEIRTLILSELALQPEQTIWDIGAGTGSVSIEIGRLVPSARIYSLEKSAIGIDLIQKNSDRFKVNNIQPISGKAPQALAKLPKPDRVFIGGSGGDLTSIFDVCQEKIAITGIIVLAVATVENLIEAIAWGQKNGWHYSLLQIQVSRSSAIASLTRFAPLNPVTIIRLSRQKKKGAVI